jgi:hypothetical protein
MQLTRLLREVTKAQMSGLTRTIHPCQRSLQTPRRYQGENRAEWQRTVNQSSLPSGGQLKK